ncbi:MAG: hypothetical protein EZS28_030811 [Streblomastix strix]|uniref:Uncharacterized protein n=1 Tax=Streblomastix strix TaxID=222440 RepID=A0A5J4UTH0_9EUKA|nr:MAG: hypothetical protein EZS28_030811 [Streblomastix strix]
MNQAQALKNLMENKTSIEYFNDGYIMKAKDMIKMYEEGKKSAKTLTQAQQTKLLLQARGGGQTKPKRATKRQIESDFDEDADDKYSQSERKFQSSEQLYSDDEGNDQTIIKKPMKTPKPTPYSNRDQADSSTQKTKKKPQINYTSPQVDLEELICLRTENAFLIQQHQDSIKIWFQQLGNHISIGISYEFVNFTVILGKSLQYHDQNWLILAQIYYYRQNEGIIAKSIANSSDNRIYNSVMICELRFRKE